MQDNVPTWCQTTRKVVNFLDTQQRPTTTNTHSRDICKHIPENTPCICINDPTIPFTLRSPSCTSSRSNHHNPNDLITLLSCSLISHYFGLSCVVCLRLRGHSCDFHRIGVPWTSPTVRVWEVTDRVPVPTTLETEGIRSEWSCQ